MADGQAAEGRSRKLWVAAAGHRARWASGDWWRLLGGCQWFLAGLETFLAK